MFWCRLWEVDQTCEMDRWNKDKCWEEMLSDNSSNGGRFRSPHIPLSFIPLIIFTHKSMSFPSIEINQFLISPVEYLSYSFCDILKIKLISKYTPLVCAFKNYNLNSREKFEPGPGFERRTSRSLAWRSTT